MILGVTGLLLLPGLAMSQPHVRCANYAPQKKPLFGETHAHTAYSFDAFSIGTHNPPSDSYRYAKGGAIQITDAEGHPTRCAQLVRPLDWAALTDHSEFFGELTMCLTEGAPGYDSPSCANYRANPETEANIWGEGLTKADPPAHPQFCGSKGELCYQQSATLWTEIKNAAETAYDRTPACTFTSFIGYEWTSMPGANNRHRNVIFRDDRVPERPVSVFDSTNDETVLWSRLKSECLEGIPGCQVITIPHNGNLSDGHLYNLPPTADAAYAAKRSAWEPLSEIHQGKGNSECRTGVGTTDPECGFEQLVYHNLSFVDFEGIGGEGQGPEDKPFAPNSFLRNVLKNGLADERRLGENPFKFGFAGGTDTHSALPGGTDEGNFQGIHGAMTASPEGLLSQVEFNAGALTVAWAEENTREAIFDALKRRETYATSGTRPVVRFFAGWDLPADLCNRSDFVTVGYAQGVPMGSDLLARPAGSTQGPSFAVMAMKDPIQAEACETAPAPNCWVKCPGAQLNRIEIVKGWIDAQGQTHEKVFTVAGPDRLDPKTRVDPNTCKPVGPGSSSLCSVWKDPEFDPASSAFYYARVLENPSCRWSTYTCKSAGLNPFDKPACLEKLKTDFSDRKPVSGGPSPQQVFSVCCNMVPGPAVQPTEIPIVEQQRAWTSPVWYKPAAPAATRTSALKP